MAVDLTNRRLYIDKTDPDNPIGITPQEVSLCLQDYRVDTNGNVDVGMMCSSPKLEEGKWNKHKPIRFNKWTKLTENEFKGMSTDAADGVYFGIQFPASMSGVLNSSIFDIHNAEFTYLPPRGVTEEYNEPFRLDDFDGYHHRAEPNPLARFNKESDGTIIGYRDDMGDANGKGGLRNINVKYIEDADGSYAGINLVSIYASLADITVTDDMLARTYPCILISDANNTFNYFTALEYEHDNGEISPRPLKKDGVIAQADKWSVKFTKTLLSNVSLGSNPPFSQDMSNLKASIFLLEAATVNGPWFTPVYTDENDFGSHWFDASEGVGASSKAIVIPDDNGVTINIRRWALYSYYMPKDEANPISQSGAFITVPLAFYNPENEATGKTVEVTVSLREKSSGTTVTREFTATTPNITMLPNYTFSDFGMVYAPNQTLTFNLTVTTKYGELERILSYNNITIVTK